MRNIKDIKTDLRQAQHRFLDVVKNGDAVLSDYDLSMGYDADYYLNRVPLLANHITYYRRELKQVLRHGEQTVLF